MGATTRSAISGALVLGGILAAAPPAHAQDGTIQLPQINVTASRIVSNASNSSDGAPAPGVVGASTTVITAQDIQRSPSQSIPDILSQVAGVQVQHLFSPTNGSRDTVDLRGFGAFASSNTLILVNGRRYQDFDSQGFDFSSIPLNSIERIEVTRGNSGTVLYGDGAIGGVVNIVTKNGAAMKGNNRVEAIAGSYGYREGRGTFGGTWGPWSASLFTNGITSQGYRVNSNLWQDNAAANLAYTATNWSAYLNIAIDKQRQGLPGGLRNVPTASIGYTLDTPWQSNTPNDWGKKQGINVTTGVTATLSPGVELIIDGGARWKSQQALFYSYTDPNTFAFNPALAAPMNDFRASMLTLSLTPRIDASYRLADLPNHLLTGIDIYDTQYASDRRATPDTGIIHQYAIRQTTAALYAMNTVGIRPDTDISFGARAQYIGIRASDVYDASADIFNTPAICFGPCYTTSPQAAPFSGNEGQWAAHLGVEHRINSQWTVFARVAHAFRVPNADERVGAGNAFTFVTPTFDLKTQTSEDVEGGVRVKAGPLNYESSVYLMNLKNEIYFLPLVGTNLNLDPTRRIGWENTLGYQLTPTVRLHATAAYVQAKFREGQFAGNDIPLISRWTGTGGFAWDIWQKYLVFDLTTRLFSSRYMDNDQANQQPKIPANATVDMKLGGKYEQFFWSVSALNVLGLHYFDYAVASGGFPASMFGGAVPGTPGVYNGYPLAGRTFIVQAGATF